MSRNLEQICFLEEKKKCGFDYTESNLKINLKFSLWFQISIQTVEFPSSFAVKVTTSAEDRQKLLAIIHRFLVPLEPCSSGLPA